MESREQAEQAAVSWIARRETGPWSEQDEVAFERWLSGSMSRQVAYYRFKRTWGEVGRLGALGSDALPEQRLSDTFDEPDTSQASLPVHGSRVPRYALVASVLLAVVFALFLFRNEIFGLNSYSTEVGGLTAVPMADGSRVILNTNSRVRIVVDKHARRIDLQRGEAFFEVAKDPSRPFVVTAGEKQIVAVGTQFSVRREGENIRVAVTEGAVRLMASPQAVAGEQAPGVLLSPGAVARAERTGVRVQEQSIAEIEQQLTWRTGILTFRNTPLMEAVAEFNRYNERQIFIEDPGIAAIEVGGVFRSTDLDPFVRLIEDGLSLKVSRSGDRTVLSAR